VWPGMMVGADVGSQEPSWLRGYDV